MNFLGNSANVINNGASLKGHSIKNLAVFNMREREEESVRETGRERKRGWIE